MELPNQSRRSCCAFCALARICLSPCDVLSFLLRLSHAKTIHIDSTVPIKTQVRSQLISLSVHAAVASVNKSLTFQCLRILEHIVIESTRKEIAHGSGAMTNMAEVPKLAARPTPYDNDERTWLEFSFKLENYFTLVNEGSVALLQDAESQPVAKVPAGTDESSMLMRTLNHALYALSATLTTGRRFAMVQAAFKSGMGDNLAKFEEAWKTWEHQVDVYEKLATSMLDDDVTISVVLREAPTKLQNNLLVNSQHFESNYNKMRATIQAYLNPNKSWIANHFRNDATAKARTRAKATEKAKAKERCPTCAERKGTSRETAGHEQTKTEQ